MKTLFIIAFIVLAIPLFTVGFIGHLIWSRIDPDGWDREIKNMRGGM